MILTGVVLWLIFVLWHNELLQALYSNDRSRICWLITLVFVVMLVHSVLRGLRISCIANESLELEKMLAGQHTLHLNAGQFTDSGGKTLPLSPALMLLKEKLGATEASAADGEGGDGNTREWLYEHIARGNQVGWFSADFMIKLGLLGTVIGFIFMLGTITRMEDVDANAMRIILQEMGTGMATALLTTMAGLVCSMLLGVLYFTIDHYAMALIDSNHSLFYQARKSLRPELPGQIL